MSKEFTSIPDLFRNDVPLTELEVRSSHLTPETIWDEKDEDLERERESLKWMESVSKEDREVICEIVGRGLTRMHDRLDQWVPASLKIEQGEYLEVKFRLLFTDLEREKAARVEISERQISEAIAKAPTLLNLSTDEEG